MDRRTAIQKFSVTCAATEQKGCH